jgi:hypothetical protein
VLPERVTLAEAPGELGYDTAAFAANQAFLARRCISTLGYIQ